MIRLITALLSIATAIMRWLEQRRLIELGHLQEFEQHAKAARETAKRAREAAGRAKVDEYDPHDPYRR